MLDSDSGEKNPRQELYDTLLVLPDGSISRSGRGTEGLKLRGGVAVRSEVSCAVRVGFSICQMVRLVTHAKLCGG